MGKIKKSIACYLILTLCSGPSFAGNRQSSLADAHPIQADSDVELANREAPGFLVNHQGNPQGLTHRAQLAPGDRLTADASKRPRAKRRRGVCTISRAAAFCIVPTFLAAIGLAIAAPFIWPTPPVPPACPFIFDPATNICSLDDGKGVPYNPGDPHRSMYVSLWTDAIMNPVENDQFVYILGDPNKVNSLLSFIAENKIDELLIYDLGSIFDQKGMSAELSNFIIAAKKLGVKQVIATGDSQESFYNIAVFQKLYPARFDGLVTEDEFWNLPVGTRDAGYAVFLQSLDYMRSLNLTNVVSGKNLSVAAYFGWLDRLENSTATQIAIEVLSRVDRVYQNCYGTASVTSQHNLTEAYFDCSSRMVVWLPVREALSNGTKFPPITPLLSAEGQYFRSVTAEPEEYYLGPWLEKDPSLDALEAAAIPAAIANGLDPTQFYGFSYFQFCYLKYAMTLGLMLQALNQSANATAAAPATISAGQ